MKLEEYKYELSQLTSDYEKDKRELARKYALANNPYKLGDIFKDHIGFIKVDWIQVFTSFSIPMCKYYGPELKKDGTPKKNGAKRWASQSNDVTNPTP